MFSFFPNGEFFLNDHGIHSLDPNGQPGIERGTYTWNETTGAFTFDVLVNTDGQWGLSDGGPSTIQIVGNTLTADGNVNLTRVVDPNSAIVRGWFVRDQPNPGDLTVLDFLPNGTYLLGSDPPSTSFLEFGNYLWDPVTGAFEFQVIDTTDPNAGFNGSTVPQILVNGNRIEIHTSEGIFTAQDVATPPVPEPETWALMLAGLGLVGALARRAKAARTGSAR